MDSRSRNDVTANGDRNGDPNGGDDVPGSPEGSRGGDAGASNGLDGGRKGSKDGGQQGDAGAPPEGPTITGGCGTFPAVTDITGNGPLATTSTPVGLSCTIEHPATLGQHGARHPVIVWGNGTTVPVTPYEPAFKYWASYGFIVAAANDVNGQGAGTPLINCLQWVLGENARAGSPFEGKVCNRSGATGHSQGGAGAIMAGQDPRVTVTAPLMPYTQQGYGGFETSSITAQQASPMLLLSGTLDDNAVPSVFQQPVFNTTNVPVFWANQIGADHYTVIAGLTNYRSVILAWFRLHLMDDRQFRGMFYGSGCSLCSDPTWIVQRKGPF
jgi:hypothetical protein